MDLPPISGAATITTTTTADADADAVKSLPPAPSVKLRLLCSYGGHIIPRPHDKSLFYAGGETRVAAVDRHTTASTMSALTAHLSRTYYNNRPFILKYLLPNEDLDSLISVTNDEDLQNMIEEHDRLISSPKPSRIRLFLFADKAESVGSALLDPKAESWFCDALRSTKIMQRRESADSTLISGPMGLDCISASDSLVDASCVENSSNSDEVKQGLDLTFRPESMVLETSSSFGSTSSSISMSNLGLIGAHGEDGGVNLPEKKIKMPSPGSVESDTSVANAIPHLQTAIYQDPVPLVQSVENRVFSNVVEQEGIVHDPLSGIQKPIAAQVPAYQSPQPDQMQFHQEVRYIQAGANYIPHYPAASMPISSFYPIYYSPMHQQPSMPYHPSPPYPVYLVPIKPTQTCDMSMQYNLADAITAPSWPLMHPHSTMVAYKEVESGMPRSEITTKVYMPVAGSNAPANVPSNQNQQPLVDLSGTQASQPVPPKSKNTAICEHDYEDELAYNQIYKTQPPAPSLLPQYCTVSKAASAPEVPNADNIKRQIGTAQPP